MSLYLEKKIKRLEKDLSLLTVKHNRLQLLVEEKIREVIEGVVRETIEIDVEVRNPHDIALMNALQEELR